MRYPLLLLFLGLVTCLPRPSEAVPTGSTDVFFAIQANTQADDPQTGVRVESQINEVFIDNGNVTFVSSGLASNAVPFPGLPPELKANAALFMDGSQSFASYETQARAEGIYDWTVTETSEPGATGQITIQAVISVSGTFESSQVSAGTSSQVGFFFEDRNGVSHDVQCVLASTLIGCFSGSQTLEGAALFDQTIQLDYVSDDPSIEILLVCWSHRVPCW
jgi:hypothetical protein